MAISVTSIKDNITARPNAAAAAPARVDGAMKNAFIASAILHVVVFAVSMAGIPLLSKKQPVIITPISIELVDISDITQTTRVAPPKKIDKPKEIIKPEPPKPVEAAPKVTAEAPPTLEEIKPEEPKKPEKIKQEPPKPEPIVEAKKEEPKPKPKPKEKPKEKPKPKEDQFASLLKNLAPDAKDEKPETKEKTMDDVLEETSSGQIARLADQLTISELDAFKYQLEPCWNVPAGAKYAENLAVEIRVTMNRDGTVNKSSVLDKGRYNRDSSFKAAADSALRALRNPRCSPLKLPSDKYEQWKSIVINFDPQNML